MKRRNFLAALVAVIAGPKILERCEDWNRMPAGVVDAEDFPYIVYANGYLPDEIELGQQFGNGVLKPGDRVAILRSVKVPPGQLYVSPRVNLRKWELRG